MSGVADVLRMIIPRWSRRSASPRPPGPPVRPGWLGSSARHRGCGHVALAAVVALPVALTAGCDAEARRRTERAAVPVGSSARTIAVGSMTRTFRLYRPAKLPSPAPLVVMLHGGFGSGAQAERAYGWNAQADSGGFVVAYPDGLGRAWSVGNGCCGAPGRGGVDDVAFVTAMVGDIQRRVSLDANRIYATGISNGGMMAYRLACRTTLFAAIGPDAATQLDPCPSPAPVSVIHIHGTADRSVRYDGGRGGGPARIDGPAIATVHENWRTVGECGEPKVTTAGAVTTSAAQCADGRSVTLIAIDGAGHQWPGADRKPTARRFLRGDEPSAALDATVTIWRFFGAHPKS